MSSGEYWVDGHDVGSGGVNIFLYAEDSRVGAALAIVIRFFEQGKLPKGMRIAKRTSVGYQPVYPPGLAEFDLMYLPKAAPPK